MESKPSRIPRRISVQPSGSLSSRMVSGNRGGSLNDSYHSRESSFRLDSEYQSASASASASPYQSTWYSESEITQGARARSQNQQRDHESKRPKLSCTNCASTSAGRNIGSGLNTVSDSSWRQSQVPRSSSMVLGSFGTDLMRERRDLERRRDSSISNLMDYNHRSGDFTTSSYVQERVPSSYSQGARPKENALSTSQLTSSSTSHQLPSDHQTVPSSRDSSRSSFRSHFSPRQSESFRNSSHPAFSYLSSRNETPTISNSERVGSSQRPFQESSDNEDLFMMAGHRKHLRDLDFLGEDGVCRLLAKIIALNQMQKILTKNQKVEIQGRGCLPHLEIDAHLCSLEGGEREEMSLQEYLRQMYLPDLIFSEENPMKYGSTPDSPQGGRTPGLTGLLPGSLFRFAVPPALGSNLTDNVMITVDIIPSGWNSADGKNDKAKSAPSRDPEKLQKIKESLLLEDSDEEEEGDLCRICQMAAASSSNLLIEPCKCTGSLQYVHQECMKKWLQAKINSGSSLEAVTTCELCKEKLQLNLEDFDIHELHRAHANEQAEYEFISSGLYLVVLLHLCEQSFSDMMGNTIEPSTRVRFINLARTLQAHMEDLETLQRMNSEEDGDHNRTEHLLLPNFI
ncbi:E3 ubiquitin-protein ligase MARCHF7 [Apodemus speciosus]|uniref:RING-type E3 ubiquitin transferase n=1 Tax=Apodemus speciosus TaxID=105296 RepID=A0ABQ0EH96_APOSI